MGIIVRQSIKTIIVTYIGVALGVINILFLFPLVLSEEQIGFSRVFVNTAMLFATFSSLGAANIPSRFFPYFKDVSKQHSGFLFLLLLLGGFGFFLFSLILTAFKPLIFSIYTEKSPMLVDYFPYLLPFTAIILLWYIFEIYTIVHQLPVVPSFLREVLTRGLTAGGLIFLFYQVINFQLYVDWTVAIYIIVLVITVLYLQINKILFLKPNLSIRKNPHLKDMLVFGGFIMMGNLSGAIIANIDGWMLSAYSGLKSTGIYSIAFFIAVFVEIPRRSLSQVLIPLVAEANKNNDFVTLRKLYEKSSINQLIIGGLLFIGIWCNIENIFRIIPHGENYLAGKWVVFFIGLSKLFDMATGINAEIMLTSKYYKIDLFFYCLLSIFGICGNIIFIPLYQLTGAAIASAISVLLFNSMRFVFIYIKYSMQPFSLGTIKVILLGMIIVFGNSLIDISHNPITDIIVRSFVIIIVFMGTISLLKVSEDIDSIISTILIRIKKAILTK